jgi:hypothetical protein
MLLMFVGDSFDKTSADCSTCLEVFEQGILKGEV